MAKGYTKHSIDGLQSFSARICEFEGHTNLQSLPTFKVQFPCWESPQNQSRPSTMHAFRPMNLEISGRPISGIVFGNRQKQLWLVILVRCWVVFQENVEPFMDALLELAGPSTECFVSFDTALNRWGAYDAFVARAQEHWQVEPRQSRRVEDCCDVALCFQII